MHKFQDIEWEVCLLEPQRDREVEEYLRRELGRVPAMARYLTPSPWVARSMADMFLANGLLAHVDVHLAQLISAVVSQERSCRFCYAQVRAMLRMQGYSDAHIRRLEGDLLAADLDPRERAALEFSRRLSRAAPAARPADLESLCEKGFERAGANEVAFIAANELYFNLLATLPAMPPQPIERFPDRLLFLLLRPLLLKSFSKIMRPGEPEPLAESARQGPFSPLVVALEGLPAARVLRRALDDAFAWPMLGVRTKALIFGVIGRGLACPFTEGEARRLAAEHGLDPKDFDQALTHLDSSALDPVESLLLVEARHTIRYRPADVQRRSRKLLQRVTVAQFVDFVGTAALANAVARLALVLEPSR